MHAHSAYLLLSALSLAASAAPRTIRDTAGLATLPQNDPNPAARKAGITVRQEGFIYGPSLIGNAAPFPNGTLGNAKTQADMDLWAVDRHDIDGRVEEDVKTAGAAIQAVSHVPLVLLDFILTVLT